MAAPPTDRVLDVGCGGNAAFIVPASETASSAHSHADVSIDTRIPIHRPENFVRASTEAIPFRNDVFTHTVAYEVLEHVDGPSHMLRELRRVTHGTVVITTPNATYLPIILMHLLNQRHRPCWDHVQTWTRAELEHLLARAGFASYRVSFLNNRRRSSNPLMRVLLAICPSAALRHRTLVAHAQAQGTAEKKKDVVDVRPRHP